MPRTTFDELYALAMSCRDLRDAPAGDGDAPGAARFLAAGSEAPAGDALIQNAIGLPPGTAQPLEPGSVITRLAELPPEAHLDIAALARILGRHRKSVERAVRRGELPPPIRLFGQGVWLVGYVLKHFQQRQEAAVKRAERREQARRKEIARVGA